MMEAKNIARLIAVLLAVLALCALALVLGSFGADAEQVKEWTKTIGTDSVESEGRVAVDPSGNIYVGGETDGNLGGAYGGTDVFVAKYSPNGVKLWVKQFGAVYPNLNRDDRCAGIATDNSGNVYILGSTDGDRYSGASCSMGWDVFLIKINSSGKGEWMKQFGFNLNDFGVDLDVDADGNICVLWERHLAVQDETRTTMFSPSGVTLWDAILTKTGCVLEGESIKADSSGCVYVGGTSNVGLDRDAFVAKFSSTGAQLWVQTLGASNANEDCVGVAVDPSGPFPNVYLAGNAGNGLDGNANIGAWDCFVAKYDYLGVKQWVMLFGTETWDLARDIAVRGSWVYITGETLGKLDNNTNSGAYDVFLANYSTAGVKQSISVFGGADTDYPNNIAVDPSRNAIYIAGVTSGDLDGNTNYRDTSGWRTQDVFFTKYAENFIIFAEGMGILTTGTGDNTSTVSAIITENISVLKTSLPSAPAITTRAFTSANGTYWINWTSSSLAERYILQQNGVAVCNVTAAGSLSYHFSDMKDGTYRYRIRGRNSVGASNWSAVVTITVAKGNLPGTPQLITSSLSTMDENYQIIWTPTAYPAEYIIEENGVEILAGDNQSYAFQGMEPGSYTYRARAANMNGTSNWSAPVTITVFTGALLPGAPQITTNSFETISCNYSINWTAGPDVAEYILEENGIDVYAGQSLTRNFFDRAVNNYIYRIKAANQNGTSNWSAPVVVSVMPVVPDGPAPEAPHVITTPFTSVEGNVTINWTEVPNATAYVVEENGHEVSYTPDAALTFENLAEGNHTFRIKVIDENGSSEWSEPLIVEVDLGEPGIQSPDEELPPPCIVFADNQSTIESNTSMMLLEGTAGGGAPLSTIEVSLDNVTWVPVTEMIEFENGLFYWSVEVNLTEGLNPISVRVIDEEQNAEVGQIEAVYTRGAASANLNLAGGGDSSPGIVAAAVIGGACAAAGIGAAVLVMKKLKKKA